MASRPKSTDRPDDPFQDLSTAVDTIEGVVNSLKSFARSAKPLIATPDPLASAKLLKQLRETVGSLATLQESLLHLEQREADHGERQLLEFQASLSEACQRRQWRLDGPWPTLYVERAVPVTVDEIKRTVSVSGKRLHSTSVGHVMAALEPRVAELLPRNFSQQDFVEALAQAYDQVRGTRSQVSVLDVYKAFVVDAQDPRFWRNARSDPFAGISVDQFRARLTKALETESASLPDRRVLRLLPPLDAKDALFLYQPAEKRFGYVGRIEFVVLGG
jgi:hypothetical protein